MTSPASDTYHENESILPEVPRPRTGKVQKSRNLE